MNLSNDDSDVDAFVGCADCGVSECSVLVVRVGQEGKDDEALGEIPHGFR